MHQINACNDQNKCANYLVVMVCDICLRNQDTRIDNFKECEPAMVTCSNSKNAQISPVDITQSITNAILNGIEFKITKRYIRANFDIIQESNMTTPDEPWTDCERIEQGEK